jgi:elongation factor P--(R)-beta-lysine ligase
MPDSHDWRPSATLERLVLRAVLLRATRNFFDTRGYIEVDTPLLSWERVIDAHLDPFVVMADPADPGSPNMSPALYLQTSPEFAMKRLIAAGATAIYQLGHVFRHGERGRLHNPEFTMLEWYRTGETHLEQMQRVEELVGVLAREFGATVPPATPFARTTYREAFQRFAGIDPATIDTGLLGGWATARGLHPPPGLLPEDRDGWLNFLLAELVEPRLGFERPEFLFDYPASQAALARVRPGVFPVAERFELYWRGIELCNGYHELPDADELERRIAAESARRAGEGRSRLPAPKRLLGAMRSGLPDCSGTALGFDRLVLLLCGAEAIDDVLPFAFERC